jgi:hypothetical protein
MQMPKQAYNLYNLIILAKLVCQKDAAYFGGLNLAG